jgi:ADP-ribose pyrophosphatase YjhB (NUDIX family)
MLRVRQAEPVQRWSRGERRRPVPGNAIGTQRTAHVEGNAHKLVADVALITHGQVLLTRYQDVTRYDGQHGWFLPDDHLAYAEHPEEAAKRIAREQLNVRLASCSLSRIESFANGGWHLIFHYRANLDNRPPVAAGDNVAAAQWFPLDALPDRSEFAHGGWAIDVLQAMGLIPPDGP